MTSAEKTALKQDLRQALGKTLRGLREKRGAPFQEMLAARVAMDARYWGSLERGERSLTLFNLWRVAEALEMTPSRLVLAIDQQYRQIHRQAPAPQAEPLAAEFRRLGHFMDQLPTMKWLADRRENCVYANQPLLDYCGCTLAQMLGQGWREFMHPQDREEHRATNRKAYRRRQPYLVKYRMRRADGAYPTIFQQAVPQFTAKGQFIGFLGTMIPEPPERRHGGFGALGPAGGG